VASGIERLEVVGEGIETIKIDLWNREISVGPLRVSRPGYQPATLERLSLTFSLKRLFDRHILTKTAAIEGARFDIVRETDGRLSINGVDVSEYFDAAASKPQDDTGKGSDWGFGLRRLDLRNGRIRFEDKSVPEGGILDLEFVLMSISGFDTLTSGSEGKFSLSGLVNNMPVTIGGTISIGPDNVGFDLESALGAVTPEQIGQFTGPTPISAFGGRMSGRFRHRGAISSAHSIAVENDGEIFVFDGSFRNPLGLSVSARKLSAAVQARLVAGSGTPARFSGTVSLDAEAVRATSSGATDMEVAQAHADLTGVSLEIHTGAAPKVGDISAARAEIGAGNISLGTDAGHLFFARTGKASLEELSLSPSPDVAERFSLRAGTLGLSARAVTARDAAGTALQLGSIGSQWQLTALTMPLSDRGGAELRLEDGSFQARNSNLRGSQGELVELESVTARLDALGLTHNNTGTIDFQTAGSARLDGFHARTPKSIRDLPGKIDMEHGDITDASVALAILPDSPADLRVGLTTNIGRITLSLGSENAFEFQAERIAAKQIEYATTSGFHIVGARLQGANLTARQNLIDAFANTEDRKAPQTDASSPVRIRIENLEFAPDAKLSFTDAALVPPFKLDAKIGTLRIDTLDSHTESVELTLASKLNEFATIYASGAAALRAPEGPTLAGSVKLDGVQLPALNGYFEKHFGVQVENGRLSAEAKAASGSDQSLKASINASIDRLKLSKAEPTNDARILELTGGIAPATAIAWLENSEGRIELQIPVSGKIEDPEFRFGQIIRSAIGGAIRETVGKTVQILFPPTFLLSQVAQATAPGAPRPVVFEPLRRNIGEQETALLKAIGKAMRDRPRLRLSACGRSTAADFEQYLRTHAGSQKSDDSQTASGLTGSGRDIPESFIEAAGLELNSLAQMRTLSVKKALIEDHGINADRIDECKAQFDFGDQGAPRVDFELRTAN
jgi:hypothetical protein